jgi:DNA polymerase (family X)
MSRIMDRHGIAIVLDEIATLLEVQGENRFKARAFTNAARAIEAADADIEQLVRERSLESIEGIGPATATVIRELVETGSSRYYTDLRGRTPSGLLQLLAVPRLGATKVRTLHERLGVDSLDDLESAAREGRIAGLPGFGERTQARILEGIAHVRGSVGRRRYADARELAMRLRAFVEAQPGIARAEIAGELRRGCETVSTIVVLAQLDEGATPDALLALRTLPGLSPTETTGSSFAARLGDSVEVRVLAVAGDEYATTLLLETGSHAHIAALQDIAERSGLSLSASGLFRDDTHTPTPQESDVYAALDLAFPEPELRETGDEVQAARDRTLPDLVTYEALRGCFHCHTTWSDGRAGVAEMAEAALDRGWRYLGIADHSRFAGYAGGLSPEEILAQHDEIDDWNRRHGSRMWLFKGIEADILPDGRLDYEDRPDLLERFDYVIASAHSALTLAEPEQTRRFLRVIENPYVTFLGHLTGRLLLARQGCALDMPAVLAAVARRGIGIEINSDPNRLDMDWRHWRAARALGIRTAINPDAHSPGQLDFVHYGIIIARKGWLEPDAIVNCGTLADVRRYFRSTRRDGPSA